MESGASPHAGKEGFMLKHIAPNVKRRLGQSKWSSFYFILIGSTLYYYKNPQDHEPRGCIELSGSKVVQDDTSTFDVGKKEKKSKKLKFALQTTQEQFMFAVEDPIELQAWVSAITSHVGMLPGSPLPREKSHSKMEKIVFSAQKNVAGKVATSSFGKAAFRSKVPEEVGELVAALKRVVERESGSAKKAVEFEDAIFKIGVKCFLLIDSGRLKASRLLIADDPLRAGFTVLEKCFNYSRYHVRPDPAHLRDKLLEAQDLLRTAGQLFIEVFEPHVKPKNVNLVRQTIGYFVNADFFLRVFRDSALEDDLENLITAAGYYMQMHYYPDD